jgi:hypothetical protein
MKHYKIIKKTFVSLNEHGVSENSTYIPYQKIGLFWFKLNTCEMYSCGFVHTNDTGFKNLEECEDFIKTYHKYHDKVGKYTVETIKTIDLK